MRLFIPVLSLQSTLPAFLRGPVYASLPEPRQGCAHKSFPGDALSFPSGFPAGLGLGVGSRGCRQGPRKLCIVYQGACGEPGVNGGRNAGLSVKSDFKCWAE